MRHLIFLLAVLPEFAGATDTAQFTQERVLSSIDGNQVHIAMMEAQGAAERRSFVSICLSVPGTHHHAKGLDVQTHMPQFTAPDQMSCIRVAPRPQRIVLLTRSTTQTVQRSMAFTADLTGFGGHQLNINWIVEVVK